MGRNTISDLIISHTESHKISIVYVQTTVYVNISQRKKSLLTLGAGSLALRLRNFGTSFPNPLGAVLA